MYSIKALPEFSAWLDGLADVTVRGVVVARLKRLELGLAGDVTPTNPAMPTAWQWRATIGHPAERRASLMVYQRQPAP